MEPRFFKRGNLGHLFVTAKVEDLLQWNHVFSNVEISFSSGRSKKFYLASMEPRFFKRGNRSMTASARSG